MGNSGLKTVIHSFVVLSLFFGSFSTQFSFQAAYAKEDSLTDDQRLLLNRIERLRANSTRGEIERSFSSSEMKALLNLNNPEVLQVTLNKMLGEFNVQYVSLSFNAFIVTLVTSYVQNQINKNMFGFKSYLRENEIEIAEVAEKFNKRMTDTNQAAITILEKFDFLLRTIEPSNKNELVVQPATAAGAKSKTMTSEAEEVLENIKVLDAPIVYSSISELKQYSDPRIVEYGLWRLNHELEVLTDKALIETLTVLLTELMNHPELDKSVFFQHESEISRIQKLFEEKNKGKNSLFKPQFEHFIRRFNSIKNYTPVKGGLNTAYRTMPGSGIVLPQSGMSSTPAEHLREFKNILDKRIIEQPEVVSALYDLEFETLVKGATSEPPFFYLMGLPGVGKDTSAESYVDALMGSTGEKHLFHVAVQKDKQDANALLGSSTGYIGSEKIPPFLRFLVLHSAGRYQIITEVDGKDVNPFVAENPKWKPGMVIDGYFTPEQGVIFLNEFHNWSAEAKSLLFKEALEKGVFKINNPGDGGADRVVVSGIRFIAASNEGIELYTNRDFDGSRIGEPLTYEEMMSRYNRVAHNKDLLRQTIAKTASKNSPGTPRDSQVGTPEEILNRIHPSRMILMRPISPEGMKKIIRLRIEKINKQLMEAEHGFYGRFQVTPTDALVDYIQAYEFSAEEGARPVSDRVRSLMEYTFYQALKDKQVKAGELGSEVTLDIKKNEDRTYSLVVKKGKGESATLLSEQLIQETIKERNNTPISDERIDNLLTLSERLKDRVFGAEAAIEKVSRAMLLSEEARHAKKTKWSDHEKATSFAFLGPSSTGKSEMAKALVNEIFPDYGEQRRIDIDFNKIQNQHHMEEFIWGRKEGRNVVPSEFMRKYDQYNGDILFVFEESSNTPKELLRSLYDLFRENHPKFADGKDRPMTNVTIILTGNAGIEWYSGVPRDLPEDVRMAAWTRIYKESVKANGTTRQTLERYYPEPLINRIGEQNVIWFAPLSFQAVRELMLAKTNSFLAKLKPADGRRGWDVGFKSQADHERIIEIFEREGFLLEEQGASVDRYVDMAINKELRALLLTNKVPTGARIALAPRVDQSEDVIKKNGKVLIDVIIEGQAERLTLPLHAKKRESFPRDNIKDTIMTGIHETGHEFVGKLLLGDKHKSDFITIIPGVAEINGEWIYYAGLRSYESVERLVYTKEAVERSIAGLLAGGVAQEIFSKGQRSDAGKNNDIERATAIAQRAVLEWGLSSAWGNRTISAEQISSLSEADRNLLNSEIKKIMNRATTLAYNTILQNREVFSELAYELLVKGEIKSEALEDFYKKNASRLVPILDQEAASTRVDGKLLPAGFRDPEYRKSHNVEVADFFKVPAQIADIETIVRDGKKAEIAKARQPKKLPILQNFNDVSPKPVMVLAPSRVAAQELPKAASQQVPRQQAPLTGGTCSSLFR